MTAAQQRCSHSTSLLPILYAETVKVYSQLTAAPFTAIIKVQISEIRGQQNRPLVTWAVYGRISPTTAAYDLYVKVFE